MYNLTIINICFVLLGLALHHLLKLQGRKERKSLPFSAAKWITENWVGVLLSIIASIAVLVFYEQVFASMGIKLEGAYSKEFAAFTAGYLNSSIFKNFIKIGKSGKEDE